MKANLNLMWLVISIPLCGILLFVALAQRRHIELMEKQAMPCFEDSVLMWVDAPNDAECIAIDDFIMFILKEHYHAVPE